MSNYPQDEFDDVPENSARHGIHRTSSATAPRSLAPLIVFGVVALVIGILAFLIIPKMNDSKSLVEVPGAATSQSAEPSASATAAGEPSSAAPSPSAVSTTPAPTTPAPSPTPSAEPAPVVNKTSPVSIFNATGISGLAAKYSGIVRTDGWTVGQAGNWTGGVQGASSIVYNGAAQKANAQALGTLLGIPTLIDSSEMGVPLAVILGPGAR